VVWQMKKARLVLVLSHQHASFLIELRTTTQHAPVDGERIMGSFDPGIIIIHRLE
jgi:hypothetical protein